MSAMGPMGQLNTIGNYNKIFNLQLQQTNQGLESLNAQPFENILAQKTQEAANNTPVMNSGIQMNVGLENMGIEVQHEQAQKDVSKMSPVEKTAHDFSNAFSDTMNSLNQSQIDAHNAAETFASGGDISVHDVMIATQKANLTLHMAVQTRNRIINAYTELNNIRI